MPPNPFAPILSYLRGDDLRPVERKFSPADPGMDWQRVQTLISGPAAWHHADDDTNSAVFACLMVLSMAAIEPRLRVYRDTGAGDPEALDKHPAQKLLDDPNPELSPEELWFWKTWAEHVDGNAYFLKLRAGDQQRGNVVQLWPISPTMMQPYTERGSGDFITAYKRQIAPGRYVMEPVQNVIHFRVGLDDRDMRKGLSPLNRLARSILTDDEAERYVASFLGNYGVPGVVITTQDPTMTQADALEIKRKFKADFGGDHRGEPGVLNNGADIKVIGTNLKDLDMGGLRNIPEARIAAVLGVPPSMAGLHVGLEQTSNYASMKQVSENFTERKLVPLWRLTAARLNKSLRPDFLTDATQVIRHDLSTVRALQEDEDAKHKRVLGDFAGGLISQQEGRAALGYPPDLAPDDTLFVPRVSTPTRAGDEVAEPQPVPPALAAADGAAPQLALPPGGKAAERKALALEQFPDLLAAIREVAEPAFEQDLASHFDGTRKRVTRRILEA